MKKLLVLLCIATSSQAFEGKGYRIVSESFHSDFKNSHIVHLTNAQVKSMGIPSSAGALSIAKDATGKINTNITLQSYHSVSAYNGTNVPQRYKYTFELSCLNLDEYYTYEIILQPDGYLDENALNYGDVQYDLAGIYPIISTTTIIGEQSSNSRGNGRLTVTN